LLPGDPYRYTYDFMRADYGYSTSNIPQISSPGPQIEYSHYFAGQLTVGFLGREVGVILDLGTDGEVAAGLGVNESSGEGYKNLALVAGTFNLQNAQPIVDTPVRGLKSESHVLPGQGHVYILRVVCQEWKPPVDLVVKLLVVSLTDQKEISFEWTRLR
jgi:hypothetical protein